MPLGSPHANFLLSWLTYLHFGNFFNRFESSSFFYPFFSRYRSLFSFSFSLFYCREIIQLHSAVCVDLMHRLTFFFYQSGDLLSSLSLSFNSCFYCFSTLETNSFGLYMNFWHFFTVHTFIVKIFNFDW
jgi:hypothetical protein